MSRRIFNILPDRKEICLLIKSAFDAKFCDKLISNNEKAFVDAKSHYPTSYRNNQRQILNDDNLSKLLFDEIKHHIPERIQLEGISKEERGIWELEKLNPKIRLCRYLPNQYFNKHLDGVHFESLEVQSKLTFMVYLNGSDEYQGGRTLFYKSKEDDTVIATYQPQKGDLIIFDHNLWHAGEQVERGKKYILRSDIMYRKIGSTPPANSADFAEGHLGYIWTATIYNNKLVTSGRDKKIKIWSMAGHKLTELIAHKSSVLSVIAFDEKTLISGSRDQTIKIWENTNGNSFRQKANLHYHSGNVLCLCQLNEQEFLSGGADGVVNRINIEGQLISVHQAHKEWVWDVELLGSSNYITISEDGTISIWKVADQTKVTFLNVDTPITAVTVNGAVIYIGTFDGKIIELFFDNEHKALVKMMEWQGHGGIVRRLKTDHAFLYSASEDNTVKVWEAPRYILHKIYQHANFVQDILLYGDHVISVSYAGEIRRFLKL